MEKTNHEINISQVTKDDFDEMQDLYQLSIKSNPHGFIQDLNFHGSICSICREFQSTGGDMLAVRINGSLIGMGGLRCMSSDCAELCKLHLHPDFQGCGLGQRLTEELLKRAKELSFEEVELHVTKTQKPAIGLYKKIGFNETGEQIFKTEIRGQELEFDTVYMSKKL